MDEPILFSHTILMSLPFEIDDVKQQFILAKVGQRVFSYSYSRKDMVVNIKT